MEQMKSTFNKNVMPAETLPECLTQGSFGRWPQILDWQLHACSTTWPCFSAPTVFSHSLLVVN